jgi:hypothetical protein
VLDHLRREAAELVGPGAAEVGRFPGRYVRAVALTSDRSPVAAVVLGEGKPARAELASEVAELERAFGRPALKLVYGLTGDVERPLEVERVPAGRSAVSGDRLDSNAGATGESRRMAIEERFQEYFAALDRSGDKDRCYVCCRTPAEVKAFFGFHEDGTPIDAEAYGIEDVVLAAGAGRDELPRPPPDLRGVPAQRRRDLSLRRSAGLNDVLDEMHERREELWPEE